MRQLVLAGAGRAELRDVPKPEPGPGEALVRILGCGICGSDMVHFREAGGPVANWGHEVIGRVEAAGEGLDPGLVGRPVVTRTSSPCGSCAECTAGRVRRCTGWVRHQFNGFSTHAVLPARLLVALPEPFAPAHVLTEPLYVGVDLVRSAGLRPGDAAVILGAGPIGLLALYWARRLGVDPVYVALRRPTGARRRLAERWGGIPVPADELSGRASRLQCHSAIVTAPYGLVPAVAGAVRYGGSIVYNGITRHSSVTLDLLDLHLRRVSLVPSFPHPQTSFSTALAAIGADHEHLGQLISHTVPLARGTEAFDILAQEPEAAVKVVIDMQDDPDHP